MHPRLPNRNRAEQGLDDAAPMIVKRARDTTMATLAIQSGALLYLTLDDPKLELLEQILRLSKAKTEVGGDGGR